MGNLDKDIILIVAILSIVLYLIYRSLFKQKKLTKYQNFNRHQLLNKQAYILLSILTIAFSFDYLLKNYLYNLFTEIFQKEISLNIFILSAFGTLTFIFILLNLKVKSLISKKDERIVNIEQEATFSNFKPIKRKVRPIRFYANYFNAIQLNRSPKDYTITDVNLNIRIDNIKKFEDYQFNTNFQINNFYRRLIHYVNSKAKLFGYTEISQSEIKKCKNLLDIKILIYHRFTNLTNKSYFASISQLFQIANNDETAYLSFLRDSQHNRFSSISVKHAILFLKQGILK